MFRSISPTSRQALAIGALLLTTVGFKLTYLETWLFDNDNYITLSTFLRSSDYPDYREAASRFYRASVDSCEPGRLECVVGSGAIHVDQTFARPIIAYFGSRLANPGSLESASEFLADITRATILHVSWSTLLVWIPLLSFLFAMPRDLRTFMAGATALFGVAVAWLIRPPGYGHFQPFIGVGPLAALATVGLAVGLGYYARAAASRQPLVWSDWLPESSARLWLLAVGLWFLRAVAVRFEPLHEAGDFLGAGVGLLPVALTVSGVTVFLAAVAVAARREGQSAEAVWIGALLLLGFVSTNESFFVTMFHIAPRGHIYLLAAPILLYVALRPNGPLVWLIPATAVFHVSIAGLLCGCIIATEIVAGLRRRKPSLALAVSVATVLVTLAHTRLTSVNAAGATSAADPSTLLGPAALVALLPGLLVLGVLGYAAVRAWRLPDPIGGLLLRAIVLAALIAVAGQVREAILSTGYQQMDPQIFMFAMFSYYLAPLVCVPGIFMALFAMGLPYPSEDRESRYTLQFETMSVLAAGLLALAAARADIGVTIPSNPFAAMIRSTGTLLTGEPPEPHPPRIVEAASPDDHYFVGPSPGDAITVVSILKMKARAVAGLLRLDAMRISVMGREQD